jgi:hypothetical protein
MKLHRKEALMQLQELNRPLHQPLRRPTVLLHRAALALGLALAMPAHGLLGWALLATCFGLTLGAVVGFALCIDHSPLASRFPRAAVALMTSLPMLAVTAVFALVR